MYFVLLPEHGCKPKALTRADVGRGGMIIAGRRVEAADHCHRLVSGVTAAALVATVTMP